MKVFGSKVFREGRKKTTKHTESGDKAVYLRSEYLEALIKADNTLHPLPPRPPSILGAKHIIRIGNVIIAQNFNLTLSLIVIQFLMMQTLLIDGELFESNYRIST